MLCKFKDVLRIRLENDPAANVELMVVDLQQGLRPFVAKPRKYPPTGRKFMERYEDGVTE